MLPLEKRDIVPFISFKGYYINIHRHAVKPKELKEYIDATDERQAAPRCGESDEELEAPFQYASTLSFQP